MASNYGFKAHELDGIEHIIQERQGSYWRHGMSTLVGNQAKLQFKFRRAYHPTIALAQAVEFDTEIMHVFLMDGRIISVPIIWFPLLHEATPEQREQYEIGGGGISLHWPEIDEDLSAAGLMAGVDWDAA